MLSEKPLAHLQVEALPSPAQTLPLELPDQLQPPPPHRSPRRYTGEPTLLKKADFFNRIR